MRTSYIKDCVETIINMAQDNNISSPLNVLELFAGEGSIFTQYLAKKCNKVIGWEIKNEFASDFEKNVPNGRFFCKDTISLLQQENSDDFLNDANIICVDNPLGKYGDEYFEHFKFINHIHKLIHRPSILAIDIIKKPYNIEGNLEWVEERKRFYNIDKDELDMGYALNFYKKILEKQGLSVGDAKIVCRELDGDLDYFYMIICVVD